MMELKLDFVLRVLAVTPAVYTQRDVMLYRGIVKEPSSMKTVDRRRVSDVDNGHDRPAAASHVGLRGHVRGWLRQGDGVGRQSLRLIRV
jgi:hypothetical protein